MAYSFCWDLVRGNIHGNISHCNDYMKYHVTLHDELVLFHMIKEYIQFDVKMKKTLPIASSKRKTADKGSIQNVGI